MGQHPNSFLEVGAIEKLILECLKSHFPKIDGTLCNKYTKDSRLTCEIRSIAFVYCGSPLYQLCSRAATNPPFQRWKTSDSLLQLDQMPLSCGLEQEK